MDVGLNNRNTLGEIAPEFKDVVFFVEATSTEQHNLWSEWSKQSMSNIEPLSDDVLRLIGDKLNRDLYVKIETLNEKVKRNNSTRVDWEQIHAGFMITIGKVGKLPVSVCFNFAIINGKKVCFYEATSRVVNHKMVEDWLITRFQLTHDKYCRWNHVNAGNFHNCVNSLDNLDKEPRKTVYKIKD
ncbi:MAG: hypothetical protein AABY15_03320 [Nanoarchaeota archaeon]